MTERDEVETEGQRTLRILAGKPSAPPASAKDMIVGGLRAAQSAVTGAYQAAISANPMAAELPVFQRMNAMNKEIAEMMLTVSKVRGL